MAIQNKKAAPKASSKTDAMKALGGQSTPEEVENTSAESTTEKAVTAPRSQTRSFPKPAITRKMPGGVIGRTARSEEAEETNEGSEADVTAGGRTGKTGTEGKIAYDSLIWQWRELTEDFINTRTGQIRAQEEFIDPDTKESKAGDADWDAPQYTRDDW